MDPIKTEKARNKYKKNQFLSTLVLYSLTAFTCILFCSSPLWFPPLFSSMKSFLFVSLPNMRSLLFNPKCLFVVCNIIIVFLVGESMLVGSTSPAADIYDEYIKRSQSLQRLSSHEVKKLEARNLEMPLIEDTSKSVHEDNEEEEEEKEEEEEEKEEEEKREEENSEGENNFNGEEEPGLPPDELKQRAEDFIARVNRHWRLEAEQLISCCA